MPCVPAFFIINLSSRRIKITLVLGDYAMTNIKKYLRQTLTSLLLLSLTAFAYAEVYKYIDADGQTHYSDQPSSRQQEQNLVLPALNSMPPQRKQGGFIEIIHNNEGVEYQQFQMIQPANEATIRGSGNIGVMLSISPELLPKHRVEVLLNGQAVAPPSKSLSAQLSNVYRGSHVITANVLNSKGKVIKTVQHTVYVHRPMVKRR